MCTGDLSGEDALRGDVRSEGLAGKLHRGRSGTTGQSLNSTGHSGLNRQINLHLVLDAEMDTAANGGGFKAYKAGSVALIRVAGDVVASPREDWSTDDGFTVKIAYTFAPAPAAAP